MQTTLIPRLVNNCAIIGLGVLFWSADICEAVEPYGGTTSCTQTAGPTRALGLFKPGQPVSLEDGFRDPPPISRTQCWWQAHGSAFTKESVTYQLEQFKAKGMGGVTIKDTLPMERDARTAKVKDLDFLSPEWLEMFAYITAECKRLGLICRCRLGSGWNEGGPWITAEMSSQDLGFVESNPIVGPTKYNGPIPTAAKGSPTVKALRDAMAFVVAVRDGGAERIDVTDKIGDDRKLVWDVPEGSWKLVSCFSKSAGYYNVSTSEAGRGLIHDHMSTMADDVHLNNVCGKMLAKIGPFEDTAFDGFNTDSWECGTPNWTHGFRKEFIARCGYDPVPYLPVLAAIQWKDKNHAHGDSKMTEKLSEKDKRFLFDFRTAVSDVIIENFCRHTRRWCESHGVAYEAEAGGPMNVPRDMIQAQGDADIPMGEFWVNPWTLVKIPSSAAHAYGRRLVSLESLTDCDFNANRNHISTPPTAMKNRIDEAFLLGGNYLTLASVEYSPIEAGLPGWVHNCGPHLNPNQTWWPMARPFFDYLGRCCFLLQTGHNVAQVAVYNTFRTANDFRWFEPGNELAKWPSEFAFDYVGDDLVQKQMFVRDGRIVLESGAAYDVLCIQPTPRSTMPLPTLEKICKLVRQGAKVVWLSKPSDQCPSLIGYPQCDVRYKAAIGELTASGKLVVLPHGNLADLVPLVEKSQNPPAWRTADKSPLRFVHRRTPAADIFFVVNYSDKSVNAPVDFRIANRLPELWIPDTGDMRPADYEKTDAGVRVALQLPARGSLFVVCRDGVSAKAAPQPKIASFEPIAVNGPWTVEFPKGWRTPQKVVFDALKSWSESETPGVRYFSGVATYRTTFQCSEFVAKKSGGATLDLGRVAEVCEVRLNGKLIGSGWHSPYCFDVADQLKAGENQLEIRVANLWHNRLVGDALTSKNKRISHMIPESYYAQLRDKKLMPSGVLGPVYIVPKTTASLSFSR